MLKIRVHRLFKKDLKRIERRGYNLDLLRTTVSFLAEQKTLPENYWPASISAYLVPKSQYTKSYRCFYLLYPFSALFSNLDSRALPLQKMIDMLHA